MKAIMTTLFLLIAGFSFATEFSVAATAQGTWADLLTGTKKLRSEGVTFTEDTRRITEKFEFLAQKENKDWKSFRTFAGRDNFRFTSTDIFFERDGFVYAVYNIATGTVSFEAAAEAFSYDDGSTLSAQKAGQFSSSFLAVEVAVVTKREAAPVQTISSENTVSTEVVLPTVQQPIFTDSAVIPSVNLFELIAKAQKECDEEVAAYAHTLSVMFDTIADVLPYLFESNNSLTRENQSALRPLKRAVQKGQLSLYEMRVFQDRLEIEKIKNAKTTLVFSFSDSSVIERPYQASIIPKENTTQLNMRSWEEEIFKEQLAAICGKHTVQKLKTGEILEFESGEEKITVLTLRNEILIGIDSPTGSKDYEIPAKDITKRKYRKVLEKLSASIKEKEPATARLFSFGILFS